MDPQHIVDSRTTTGGAAAQAVRAMVAELSTVAAGYRGWREEQHNRLAAAERALIARAETLCQST